MSSFVIKIIAIITMFIDHIGYVIFKEFSYFNYIGRISFPLFAFQLTEGYSHTHNLKKYLCRLILFAFISQIPYTLFRYFFIPNSSLFVLNIFFTLFLGLLGIYIFDILQKKGKFYTLIGLLIIILISVLSSLIQLDYGWFGIIIIFIFHILKPHKILMSIAYFIMVLAKYLPNLLYYNFHYTYILIFLGTFFPIIFMVCYNGKKGKNVKYLLYLFYPLHLLAFVLFSFLVA